MTNGVLYDPDIDVDHILLTLHGFDKESYIKNTGHDVFDEVMKTVKLLSKSEKFKRVSIVLTSYMAKNVDKIFDFIERHIPKNITICLYYRRYEQNDPEKIEHTKEEGRVLYNKLTDLGYEIETHYDIYCDDLEV